MAKQEKIFVFRDPEGDREDFEALVEGLVREGYITREQGEFGTGLENVKDELRPIAEAELTKQRK